MRKQQPIRISEDVVRTTAEILGSHSATARALQDAERRRDAGEIVEFFQSGNSIVVRGTPAAAEVPPESQEKERTP